MLISFYMQLKTSPDTTYFRHINFDCSCLQRIDCCSNYTSSICLSKNTKQYEKKDRRQTTKWLPLSFQMPYSLEMLRLFPMTIFRCIRTERADNNLQTTSLNLMKNVRKFSKQVENTVEKGETQGCLIIS